MDSRKRSRVDADSSEDETPTKKAKKCPNQSTSEENAIQLLRGLKVFVFDENTDSFTLPADCCSIKHITQLIRALLHPGNHLKTFNMTSKSDLMTYGRVGSVLDSFRNNETLTSLTFNYVSLDLTSLVPILKKNHLQSLTISKMKDIGSSIANIIDDWVGCTSLTHLDLSRTINHVDLSHDRDYHFNGIDILIARHKHLQSLILSHNHFKDEYMSFIADALTKNDSLTRLDLKNMDMTSSEAIQLAQALHRNQALTTLDISDNPFLNGSAIQAIITMLKFNKRITTLNLDGLPLDPHEVALVTTLAQANSVKCLTVPIKSAAAFAHLTHLLKKWTSLTDLTIRRDALDLVKSFANAIAENTTLKHIGIFATLPKSEVEIGLLKEAFSKNRSIISIKSSDPALSLFFDKITTRNSTEKTDGEGIKKFIDEKDWDGMWNYVKGNIEKGIAFEHLIYVEDYTPEVFVQALENYLKKSNLEEETRKQIELTKEGSILQEKYRIGNLAKEIDEAQRRIEKAKKDLVEANERLLALNNDVKKIHTQKQLEKQSRIIAEAARKKATEAINTFSEQSKRPVTSWTQNEVLTLLHHLQLGAHAKKFVENQIKGDVLVKLTTPDLRQLGLTWMKTKSVMSALYKLKHVKSLTAIPEKSPMQWTTNQVIEWLKKHELGYLAEQFRVNSITGNELVVLDSYDLTHWLKPKSIADKTKLLDAIQTLQEFEEEKPKANNEAAKKKVPKQFLCPITHEIMKDPVSTLDGHTYERTAIVAWLTHHDTSPLTNEKLASKLLIPNHQLKSLIAEFAKD